MIWENIGSLQKAKTSNNLQDSLEKAEGSRGGKIVGHTGKGKPIYESKKEKTHMQATGGEDSWTTKKKAVHLAKHLGYHDLAKHIESQSSQSSLHRARLNGLEQDYDEKNK